MKPVINNLSKGFPEQFLNGAKNVKKKVDAVVDVGVGKEAIAEAKKTIAKLQEEGKTVAIRRPWHPDYQGANLDTVG